jgi:transcriptional regulator with XRE-family HTH domain
MAKTCQFGKIELMLDIGLEIRILRERLKVSAKELSEKIGLSQSQMSRLEKGQRRIDTQVLDRIARALGVDASYFFGRESPVSTGALPPSFPETVGKLIRSERRRQHISAEDLASRVRRPKALLQRIEEGKRDLDPELAGRISRALRLPSNYFLGAQQEVIHGLETRVERLNQALAESHRGALALETESPVVRDEPDVADAEPGEPGEHRAAPTVVRRGTPVLGTPADGYPQRFDSAGRPLGEITDYVYVPELDPGDTFALYTVGNSMEGEASPSFREGDVLIFSGSTLRSRDFGFIRTEGEPAIFRQVFFDPGGTVRLQPLDLNCPARIFPRHKILGIWRLVGHIARH